MNRKISLFFTSVIFMTLLAKPAFAEGWTHNDAGNYWTYEKSDGTGAKNEWLWIDRNNDRIAECYYFDADGKMLVSTTTPDGYKVNENGEWVSEGSVMKCVVAQSNEQAAMPYVGIVNDPDTIAAGKNLVAPAGQVTGTEEYVDYLNDTVMSTQTAEKQAQIERQAAEGLAKHNYYKGLSAEKAAQADKIAKNVANAIMNDSTKRTDLERVRAAAEFTELCCGSSCYGADEEKNYRSPYGVFIAGIYTCSGSTRALGRILDYMGIPWEHANENQDTHQWCIVTLDGQQAWADGMAGKADYGNDGRVGLMRYGIIPL